MFASGSSECNIVVGKRRVAPLVGWRLIGFYKDAHRAVQGIRRQKLDPNDCFCSYIEPLNPVNDFVIPDSTFQVA